MRLLILTPEFDLAAGGIKTFYRSLIPSLRDAGVRVRVIEGSAFNAEKERNTREHQGIVVETLEVDRLERWQGKFGRYSATPGLRRHLAAAWAMWEQADFGENADIVEATDWGLLFVPPAIEASRPLVVQCHGSVGQVSFHDGLGGEEAQGLLVRLIERSVMPAATAVQTYSAANADFWGNELGRRVQMIRPAWSYKDEDAPPRSDRGLVVGRVQRWKGPEVLSRALAMLGARAPHIDWIGRDTSWGFRDRSALAHMQHAFPEVWGKRLHHHAAISPTEVAQRQRAALFNIVPSTWDVFNFTAVEAMASGRPTIVSKGAGASELIEHGANGFAFESNNCEALAGVLDHVLSETPQRLADIGRLAQDTVRWSLNPKTIVAERSAAYTKAVADFTARPPTRVSDWIADVLRPAASGSENEMSFLEHLPLHSLAAHVTGRVTRRILSQ